MRALGWTVLAKVTGQLLSWASTFIMVRLLLPEDYGLISMTSVVFNMLMILSSSGMADGLIQAKDADDRTVRSLLGLLIVINTLLFLVQFFSAPLIAAYFNDPRLEAITQAMALAFLMMPWVIVPAALLTRGMEFKAKAIVDFASTMITIAVSLALALQGYGVWALVIAQLLNLLVHMIGLNLVRSFPRMPRFAISRIGHIVQFGGVVALGSVLWGLYSNVDVIIGGRVLEPTELGFYVVAMQLAAMPMVKTMPMLVQVAFPAFCQLQTQPDQLIWYFRRTLRLAAFLSFPVFFGLAAVAPQFVPLVLGERWEPMVTPLMILSLSIPCRMIMNVFSPALKALGKPWVPVMNSLLVLLSLLATSLYAVRWGAAGLAFAWVVTAAFSLAILIVKASPALGVRVRDLVADLLPSLALSMIMVLTIWLVDQQLVVGMVADREAGLIGRVAALAFTIVVGIISYLLAGGLLFPRQLLEVVEIWRNRKK